jgi:hypothetical protein
MKNEKTTSKVTTKDIVQNASAHSENKAKITPYRF